MILLRGLITSLTLYRGDKGLVSEIWHIVILFAQCESIFLVMYV